MFEKCKETVKTALEKDGWAITVDPYLLLVPIRYIENNNFDLGKEKVFAAEKGKHKIAVQVIESQFTYFDGIMQQRLGEFVLYQTLLTEKESERKFYFAVEEEIYLRIFHNYIGKILLRENKFRFVVFNANKKEIIKFEN